jgi:3-dehydroquinate synthase
VLVAHGLLERIPSILQDHAPAHRYAVISDHHVAPLYGSQVVSLLRGGGVNAELYQFPAGEASKTRDSWSRLTDALLADGHGRDSCVVAVGGGVTGDLGGFVAATFLRGISVVQVPTSYLAMIDAAVGGKTGVDTVAGKNLVGAFHAPKCVVVDPATLGTLPAADRAEGLVEAVKHGAILDASYFEQLASDAELLMEADPTAAESAVLSSIRLKGAVVTKDELEGGFRQILNFGHTIGHALESVSDFSVGHGTAVAAGMLLEAEIGERLSVTAAGTRDILGRTLASLGFEMAVLPSLDIDDVMTALAGDKKARTGRPRYVLLRRIGDVDDAEGWSREVPDAMVREVLGELS